MNVNIGESITVAMDTQGRDAKWLTEELKVSRQRVNVLINSINTNTRTVQKLATIFGFEVSEFIALGE